MRSSYVFSTPAMFFIKNKSKNLTVEEVKKELGIRDDTSYSTNLYSMEYNLFWIQKVNENILYIYWCTDLKNGITVNDVICADFVINRLFDSNSSK